MTEQLTPEKTLDARGLQCPMPVVKTSQEIKNVSVGGILEVLATDPGSMADINAWAKSSGNE
ncbi:MAG: sulfurtransferase TusA family protein, partial [Anaerolineae bacterium]|nr:sulfurtransferase TusA family protein [Anaerolineae bacterium]